MIWRDYVKRNGLRFLSLYSTTLLDDTGEDRGFYKVLNAIIVAHVVFIILLMRISFSQNTFISIKGWILLIGSV